MTRAQGLLLAAGILLLQGSCRRDPAEVFRDDPTTLAVVGRYAITAADFEALVQENYAAGEASDAIKSRLWDHLLEEVLVLNAADPEGTGAEIVPLDQAGSVTQRREAVDALLQREVYDRIRVSDAEVESAYRGDPSEFQKGRGFLLRQITTPTRARAEEARRLLARGRPFEEVAGKLSISPGGGTPEYFEDGELPEYLTSALKGLAPGQVSQPLSVAADTWQVVRLEGRLESYTVPLEQAAPTIRLRLSDARGGEARSTYMESLRTRFPVREFRKKLPFTYQKESP